MTTTLSARLAAVRAISTDACHGPAPEHTRASLPMPDLFRSLLFDDHAQCSRPRKTLTLDRELLFLR